jgi:hypothetical protein
VAVQKERTRKGSHPVPSKSSSLLTLLYHSHVGLGLTFFWGGVAFLGAFCSGCLIRSEPELRTLRFLASRSGSTP